MRKLKAVGIEIRVAELSASKWVVIADCSFKRTGPCWPGPVKEVLIQATAATWIYNLNHFHLGVVEALRNAVQALGADSVADSVAKEPLRLAITDAIATLDRLEDTASPCRRRLGNERYCTPLSQLQHVWKTSGDGDDIMPYIMRPYDNDVVRHILQPYGDDDAANQKAVNEKEAE